MEKKPDRDTALGDLQYQYECLLMTLRASNHYWIKGVYRNANAYYQTWREKFNE